jgi:hypothetical protein
MSGELQVDKSNINSTFKESFQQFSQSRGLSRYVKIIQWMTKRGKYN